MARAFVIFQDSPSSSDVPTDTAPSSSPAPAATSTAKENLHPITGARTSTKSRRPLKDVLTTKQHNPPPSGKSAKPRTSSSSRKGTRAQVVRLARVEEDPELVIVERADAVAKC
ncbi:hypothetical protein PLICRDRAFT_258198 [Plicaturopsis crispa FD-325 SS-3]|nr:hypothetical protein PLICRDRAFT_258198 [Plicaturopsis crispa FD-325 SS-3]